MKSLFQLFANHKEKSAKCRDGDHADELSRTLIRYIKEKKMSNLQLACAADMGEIYISQLVSGRRKPTRERLIRICIALKMTLEETQFLLEAAGLPALDRDDRLESVIMRGIIEEMDLHQIYDEIFIRCSS